MRQVAEAVPVVVHLPHVGVGRTVEQQHTRELAVARDGEGGRDVGLGTQLVVEVEVHEEALLVRRLAVFEVDLSGDGVVPRRDGGHALRDLDRVEPHAGRVTQPVGGAQAPHDRTVLVEDLGVGPGQPEHLDLPRTRDGVAVAYGDRGRVLERLREVAAGHLAQPGKGDHLPLDDAVALDEVAALRGLDHDALQFDPFGSKPEGGLLRRGIDAQRVVHIPQKRRPRAVRGPSRDGAGRRPRRRPRSRPSSRPSRPRLRRGTALGIAHLAPELLRTQRSAHAEGEQSDC